jgi:GH43 family beta-xylosidase
LRRAGAVVLWADVAVKTLCPFVRVVVCVVALMLCACAQAKTDALRWKNPLVEQRADPHVSLHDGQYLMIATVPEYDRIELRKAGTLDGLGKAEGKVLWRKRASGPMSAHIWAPELHRIGGKWYVYFAAGRAEKPFDIRMYILENASADPFAGEWVEKGQLKTQFETFSLDATTFEHRGTRYLVWTDRDPKIKGTNIYIAKMDTPWSVTGPQVLISKPELPWEQIRYWVNEGPAVLMKNGKIFITYSAAGTGAEYCLGLLTAEEGADLLDAKSWKNRRLRCWPRTMPRACLGRGITASRRPSMAWTFWFITRGIIGRLRAIR